MATDFLGTGNIAPKSPTYIVQTADDTLQNEQALSALATGILQVTTTTGVLTSLAIPLTVPNGGTGIVTMTDGGVLVGNGTGVVQVTSAGTSGQVLTSTGAGSDPTFQAAAGGGAWEFVSETTGIAAAATIDITGILAGYDYKFSLYDVTPASDAVRFWMRTSANAGVSYDAGASDYNGQEGIDDHLVLVDTGIGNLAGEYASLEVLLINPGGTRFTSHISLYEGINSAANPVSADTGGHRISNAAVDAVRFLWASGNIDTASIRVYRRAHS